MLEEEEDVGGGRVLAEGARQGLLPAPGGLVADGRGQLDYTERGEGSARCGGGARAERFAGREGRFMD